MHYIFSINASYFLLTHHEDFFCLSQCPSKIPALMGALCVILKIHRLFNHSLYVEL